jgi:DNA-directed RNA polymerase specialized sigma24 family protein
MQRSKDGVSCDSPVARLYELHATAIFAYLRRQAASREDAEDLLVEVFVAAVESSAFDRLDEKEQVAWLRPDGGKGLDCLSVCLIPEKLA